MSFLDPKERVIDLQLTSYGRYLLSIGRLKPTTYAFFDSDIIYDKRFTQLGTAVTKELQNDIEPRIQEDTPRLSAQSLYRGTEIGVFSTNPNLAHNLMPGVLADTKNEVNLTQTPDKSYIFADPLGTSAYNTKNAAAWSVGFYKTFLATASIAFTGSNNDIPTTFIPQLDCSIKYYVETYEANLEKENTIDSAEFQNNAQSTYITNEPIVFKDNTYMIYNDDFALLKIEELNTEFMKENFELEVFKILDTTGSYSEVLEKLKFAGERTEFTPKDVEYYFDIVYDFEIDEEEFCRLRRQIDKVENIYVDSVFNCEGKQDKLQTTNIYATAENQESEDVC